MQMMFGQTRIAPGNVAYFGLMEPAIRILPRQTDHSGSGHGVMRLGCQGQRNRVEGNVDLVRGYRDDQGT